MITKLETAPSVFRTVLHNKNMKVETALEKSCVQSATKKDKVNVIDDRGHIRRVKMFKVSVTRPGARLAPQKSLTKHNFVMGINVSSAMSTHMSVKNTRQPVCLTRPPSKNVTAAQTEFLLHGFPRFFFFLLTPSDSNRDDPLRFFLFSTFNNKGCWTEWEIKTSFHGKRTMMLLLLLLLAMMVVTTIAYIRALVGRLVVVSRSVQLFSFSFLAFTSRDNGCGRRGKGHGCKSRRD
jgi:hypothetical protein